MSEPRKLAECRREDVEPTMHALVYGRTRVWNKNLSDESQHEWHWSKYAWWKAMWYPHRGSPSNSGAWGLYAGSGGGGFTGPGDAELSHWMPLPDAPTTKRA